MLADAGGAGEEQVIERQARKRHAHLGLAGDHRNLIFGKDVSEHLREHAGGLGGGFAHLDHHAVARCQRAGQRPHGQIEGVVPGDDHADHAEWLVDDLGLAGLEGHADMP